MVIYICIMHITKKKKYWRPRIMVLIKVIFYTALYLFLEYLEKRTITYAAQFLGLLQGWDDDYLVKRPDYLGVFGD